MQVQTPSVTFVKDKILFVQGKCDQRLLWFAREYAKTSYFRMHPKYEKM